MAIDGSFSLERELKRFLHRCPKLQTMPCFENLLNKGDKITEDEVVRAVGQLVLHPNYTIPLLGCFRPIAQKIVERTVELLHLVPNLRSDDDSFVEEFDEDMFLREDESVDCTEIVSVIDVYVRRGKGLRLHEFACLALCQALDLIPFLLGAILNYFKAAPAPFERIRQCNSVSCALAMGPNQLLNVVRASYRFLLLRPEVFTTLWDWSCILDLAQHCTELNVVDDAMIRNNIFDLRWCSSGILSAVLSLSVRATENLGLDSEEAFQCYLRWQEFCMDVSLEKGGWYLESSKEEVEAIVGKNTNLKGGHSFFRSFSVPNEIDQSNQFGMSDKGGPRIPFVLTSPMTQSFEMASLAVNQRWPVLLCGPAGCGKTALTKKLANDYGGRVLSIHMDDQIDGKTLLGSYVCTEQPGEFRWQPGSLTQAVVEGFWVVFEDIDKAPPDILSIILPLLEGAIKFSTGHGEAVRVNERFRLFSTVTSSNPDTSRLLQGRNSLGAVWRKVMIAPPSKQDLLHIVLEWYPELEYLAHKLIETFGRVNQLMRSQLGLVASSSYNDMFTLRDLLKLCKRVASLNLSFGQDMLSAYACENIYKEAIDVFASFSTSAGNRLVIMREIAKLWAVAPAETLYPVNKPIIQELKSGFQVGRAILQRADTAFNWDQKPFVQLRASIHALEKVACSTKFNEPVLLVGETGTGKTTLVQTLASRLGQKLTVLNLSQQSDVADLLGGFKPIDASYVCHPLYQEFENLFTDNFPSKANERLFIYLTELLKHKNWKKLLRGFQKYVQKIDAIVKSEQIVEIEKSNSGKKRKRSWKDWEDFSKKLERAQSQVSASNGMLFSFVEGAFVTALRNGDWILLDEVNLAPPEILQRVVGVLEDEKGSICLAERGDIDYVCRHPDFRMFACMNPATDAGKRELPISLRGRFTEYFIDDMLDDEDLVLFINQFMAEDPSCRRLTSKIVQFYKTAKEYEEKLQDGANQKPHYSLRSLYRALEYLKEAKTYFEFEKSVYDGFCMFFLNSLDDTSAKLMNSLICKHLLGGKTPQPLLFESYILAIQEKKESDIVGRLHSEANDTSKSSVLRQRVKEHLKHVKERLKSYVLTESVKEHLKNLAKAIFIRRYPVLLQGPTSSGKTSLVWFLAALTGHEFVRINNHEHTDLQEYLGSYITDLSGKLVFQEGPLVKAVRQGHWIVLDELNLAPSDVLEALNRLLDDNRELFVPEIQEHIRAHPDFMLFATQNPPLVYGGRKVLSRAFRNRFVEIHVDEIPQEELRTILKERCEIPESRARKMVDVMKELQLHRQSSKIFAGKHGFITPRDLFRWAGRLSKFGESLENLAYDGYYLLAERLRDDAEKGVVKEVLERQLRMKFPDRTLYGQEGEGRDSTLNADFSARPKNIEKITWTKSLQRMYFLIERCYEMREPVLLVGETGGGKTTVCQLLSIMRRSKLHILNCHQYTETSDFLGGFYPVRERSRISMEFRNLCDKLVQSKAFIHFPGDAKIPMDINQASMTLNLLSRIIKRYRDRSVSHAEVTANELGYIEKIHVDLCQLQSEWQTIFMWQDGPLVEAMKKGDMFLIDEISLADDSVLERLNSVLEPERKLSMAEKGGSDLENIVAHPNFFLLATMNPGGDYGKKELSPALRNRFTEIWVPSVSDGDELKHIAHERIFDPKRAHVVDIMLKFWEWFTLLQTGRLLTVRDLLSWVSFINVTESLPAESALIHGAFLVLLDGLSLGTNITKVEAAELRVKCLSFLLETLKGYKTSFDPSSFDGLESYGWADTGSSVVITHTDNMECDNRFGVHPFYIERGTGCIDDRGFEFLAPTTRRNTLRVLRAMQLSKPVLLEGSPGVGKTSLVVALGRFSGNDVVRINLSEQTDIMDLLGSDLPVESDEGIRFSWSDGILLQALKRGSWVLLDELNLAPQSVLEGLNAILDHRAEVFIPELGCTFKCPASFRVFACQNPSYQGGGRKGLPKSFLNRFTKVYVDELVDEDYLSICSLLFPSIERSLLLKLVVFNKRLHQETMLYHKFGQDGSPWEFNLRDVIRSCEIIQDASEKSKSDCFLSSIYLQRMRTSADRIEVMKLYEQVFGVKPFIDPYPRVTLSSNSVIVGNVSLERSLCQSSGLYSYNLKILPGLRHCLEAAGQCVKHQWLCILVGPPSSGKTSLVRLLSELSGNVLNELNLSTATDISELLGCFEQYNASRHYHQAIARVERYMNEYCNSQLELCPESFIRRKDLTTRWLALLSNVNNSGMFIDNLRMRASIEQLIEIIKLLKLDVVDKKTSHLSWSDQDLDSTLDIIRKLKEDREKRQHSVKFEWVTGVLVKAIENGEWVVLENANLCNPTVLDRINSLVEQSGSITINECGTVEGNPVVIHPHRKFRMFLTVNPSYGEVSRAMRNRGVEIYLMEPCWLVDQICSRNLEEVELKEVKRFIVLSGIPVSKVVEMMAKAHIYAKREGSHLDVSITYLELSRWVQLFQRLITNGNRPAWSLQVSWEHTYLSSLGEGKGKEIVSQAAGLYLSMSEVYDFISSDDGMLCLPGGWPTPLTLRDYVSHSREANVRQNIMYLESVGSQFASRLYSDALNRCSSGKPSFAGRSTMIHLMDAAGLHKLMFPRAPTDTLANCGGSELELVLARQKLSLAADWAMEQATENDYRLYIQWFEWFGTRLQPFFSFFNWYSDLLKKELQHSIWTRIFQLRSEIMSLCGNGRDLISIPILSMELIDLCPSGGMLKSWRVLLMSLIKCVSLLRVSLQQWSKEKGYNHDYKIQTFEPVLTSLRRVEEKVLDLLVESPSFDVLFKLYSDLIKHHILFWDSLISSQSDRRLIYWRSLMKRTKELQGTCPAEVEELRIAMKKLANVSSVCLNSSKSLLWKHGGHPILPSSGDLYKKQCTFSDLCEMVWPRKNKFIKLDGDEFREVTVNVALFSNAELRVLAIEGVCMSSYIISKADDNDSEVIQQLEEMYQLLVKRLDSEKQKLVVKSESSELASLPGLGAACCVFTPDILCRRSGVENWLKTQPMVDETSLCLDLKLLQHLTGIAVVDTEEQHHTLLELAGLLKSSLNFSLDYSSRPLTDSLPHQKILWTLDAWESVQGANEKISSFVLDMWFTWHATLWETCPMIAETFHEDAGYGILLPHKLFWPLKLAVVDQILQNTNSVRDYHFHNHKIRAASRNIWLSSGHMISSHDRFLCVARSLFQQIIHAHQNSFEDSGYAQIRSAFHSIQKSKNQLENMKLLLSLLASSNHIVFTSLIDTYIEPLLSEMYPECPSDDIQTVGHALVRIGGLRYNLLVRCDDLDPTSKYSIKYSELTEKITSLEIEIQVRKECIYLAGNTHQREADSGRINLLEELNSERRMLQRKMVFRPYPDKFKEMKYMCDEFLLSVESIVEWISVVKSLRIEDVINQVRNWQEITTRFIDRLSNEYSSYVDITEPVQVAVYEMKLGLSLIVSGVLSRRYLANDKQDMKSILSTIYKFVRFPRECVSKIVSINVGRQPILSTPDIELPMGIEDIDMNMLQNIIAFTGGDFSIKDASSHTMDSTLPLKVSVYQSVLAQIKISAADARFLGGSSFEFLHEIFDDVASLWVKHRAKPTDESKAQQFKFRERAFNIESIINIDVSNCAILLANDSFSEWQELLAEELDEKVKIKEEGEPLEQDWNAQESDLDGIVNTHNQIFGSVDLVQRPGNIQVSDVDRLSSFLGSYTLGIRMTRDLKGSFSSSFDAKIAPEHLLRLCVEHDDKFIPLDKSTRTYNFYKDSNSPMMSGLVQPVAILKQRIIVLLKEWEDHPVLQKIIEVIDMILALPLDTPLAKALSALEFLLNRVSIMQETVAKFPLSEQLEPIFGLVSSWHRLECESWPALLDEVRARFEINAGRLWFPLYNVFHPSHSADLDQHNCPMIESLEEFFKTSSIGEFKKQLQLLLSFHGQINSSMSRRSSSIACQEENVKILYNTFGFYVQLLPRILEYIEANRRSIEKELNELLRLRRWDRIENHLAIENFKRTRLKLRKIVRKYTDLLQQPLMEFLGQETTRRWSRPHSIQGEKFMIDPYKVIRTLLDIVDDQTQSKAGDSSMWFADWSKTLERAGEVVDGVKDSITLKSSSLFNWEKRKQLWYTIENLCSCLIHCGDLWEDKSKNFGKRRAFSDLLMLLDSCGLSKHRTSAEGEWEKSHSWLLQPSYDVQHLLLAQSDNSSGNVDIDVSQSQNSSVEIMWRTANKYYFKSIASLKFLEKISLQFHKDFSLVQVKRSGSYVDHLIEIQQEQRALAYNFAKKLKCLRQYIWPLSNFASSIQAVAEASSGSTLIMSQQATFKCMWQQKQLFDGFYTLLYEEHLLLKKFESNHLDTCTSIKGGVQKIRLFFQKLLPDFQRSKNLLDDHLLGSCEDIAMLRIALHPFGVTKEMEQLVNQNFNLIREFEKDLSALLRQEDGQGSVRKILLGHAEDLFAKVHEAEEEFYSSTQTKKLSDNADVNGKEGLDTLESNFDVAVKRMHKHILDTFQSVGSLNYSPVLTGESLENMKEWKILFEKDIEHLQLDRLCEDVLRTIQSAGELLNHCGDKTQASVCEQLRNVHVLLDMILAFGDNLLQDFLVIHTMVSKVSYALANIFASLFTEGFGTTEDQEDDDAKEVTQEADGTGMGEGAGLNDVSDQINDEDQLLGPSEKPNEERDDKPEMPSKTEKGIEMEEDFQGDAFSLSEDSEDDESEDNEEEQLESAMEEVGPKSDVVDEKLVDINDDDNHTTNEKYEHGPSVKDKSSQDEELRAKDDSAATEEDEEALDAKESTEHNDENGNAEGEDGAEDMDVDKDDAVLDASGINPEDQNQKSEQDANVDEMDTNEPMESEDQNGSDIENDEERVNESLEDEGLEDSTENGETATDDGPSLENKTETDTRMPKPDLGQSTPNDNAADSAGQSIQNLSDTADPRDFAPDEQHSDLGESKNDLAPTSGQPNDTELGIRVADTTSGKILSNEQSSQTPSESLIQKVQPNPCRSIGDALDGWKERVKVSVDLQDKVDDSNDMVEENADEYGYTAEFKEGSAQALGPATADQIKGDIAQDDNDRDVENIDARDPTAETESQEMISEPGPIRNSALNPANDVKKLQGISALEMQPEEPMEVDGDYSQNMSTLSESLVSVKRPYMNDEIPQLTKFPASDDELGKAQGFEPSIGRRDDAATLWRRYESLTTRLSQELAEQLRLVMEPTLASKLQGDYKTGKRINMKKVIPYIASHYRKDKIWLRRTRPSKRDYQVVIAVDDSRSMSEGRCGNFAMEALVTVCRAMSQLEVGNLAVTSFGQQGNIRLLHDFDHPFTPEAGIKMISSLTFKQENTIVDEPMVDLLKYLNNMLDTAVMQARLPSGYNPLQQLVLIIADGRFNEKEKLKRYVRDILSKKRMVAFLVLDSPNESIIDFMEATVQGNDMKFSKYLDSFPFPYYVVLKNIEALPRTLADLLRQWFELMQNSRE